MVESTEGVQEVIESSNAIISGVAIEEKEHIKVMVGDFDAISIMIRRAEAAGLLAEVIESYGTALNIPERCLFALDQWDC